MLPGSCCIAIATLEPVNGDSWYRMCAFRFHFWGRKVNWNQASHVRASSVTATHKIHPLRNGRPQLLLSRLCSENLPFAHWSITFQLLYKIVIGSKASDVGLCRTIGAMTGAHVSCHTPAQALQTSLYSVPLGWKTTVWWLRRQAGLLGTRSGSFDREETCFPWSCASGAAWSLAWEVGEQVICEVEMFAYLCIRWFFRRQWMARCGLCFIDNEACRLSLIKRSSPSVAMFLLMCTISIMTLRLLLLLGWRVPSPANPADMNDGEMWMQANLI